MPICDYGCNQEAKFQLQNGKYCCSSHYTKCPEMKKKFTSVHLQEKIKCEKCGNLFYTGLFKKHFDFCLVNNCKYCQKPINKNKQFCNETCAAYYNNKNSLLLINIKRGPKTKIIYNQQCLFCGKMVTQPNKYCNNICQGKFEQQYFIDLWLNNEIDGSTKDGCSHRIKRYLLEKQNKTCAYCNNSEWMGKPITLEIEHIDGNWQNNRPENLVMICPNCHSMTATYKSKNKGNGRKFRKKYYCQEEL